MSVEMDPSLFDLYARELAYLRERGAEFAAAYPKVAARLGMAGRQFEDPHTARLVEAFAFLTARLQREITQDLPELTTGLLGVLHPAYASPIPSMAVASFEVDAEGAALTSGVTIDAGTMLFAESAGRTCWFRTAYPVTLWPITLEGAAFVPWDDLGISDAAVPGRRRPAGAIRLRLSSRVPLSSLGCEALRFYIHGDPIESARLYDLLFEDDRAVLVRGRDGVTSRAALAPVGFGADEGVIPSPSHAHPAHRLVQEYFVFPRKFMFFDVAVERFPQGKSAEILIFVDRRPGNVDVRDDSFRLACAPIVNLFTRTTEPIRVDRRRHEYRVVGDARRERFTEIHTVLEVSATGPGEPLTRPYAPFFSFSHKAPEELSPRVFWYARRTRTGRVDLPGSDVHLTFVDLDLSPESPPSEVVYARALCTNRGLAEEIDAGATLSPEAPAPVSTVTCLTKPTPQIDAPEGGQALWRLVSNLSLNHLSISGEHATLALREVLRAYLFASQSQAEKQIDAIARVGARPVSRRVGRGFGRGTEVTLELSEADLVDSSPILFASVLARLLSLQAHLNSFTQLSLRSKTREEVWKRWPPMAGAKPLL
jgi:type VI secretion system protein ImpG